MHAPYMHLSMFLSLNALTPLLALPLCTQHSTAQQQVATCLCDVQSEVATVDLDQGRVVRRFKGIGTKSHGLVWWRDSLLMLDSGGGSLIRLDPSNGSWTPLYKVSPHTLPPLLWPCHRLPSAPRALANQWGACLPRTMARAAEGPVFDESYL